MPGAVLSLYDSAAVLIEFILQNRARLSQRQAAKPASVPPVRIVGKPAVVAAVKNVLFIMLCKHNKTLIISICYVQ